MIAGSKNAHLSYCLNVHPAETWEDTFDSIKKYPTQIRDAVAPGQAFGLGLRISHKAAVSLQDSAKIAELKEFLEEQNLYVFTINGFPYGPFHGETVKQDVYKPDWRTDERLSYTLLLADILSELLPEGVSGSISTVPCSYKSWIKNDDDVGLMVKNLFESVNYLEEMESKTGKEIHLGLEPEPDCFLENTDEVINFFSRPELQTEKVRRYLGVCFDTCHLAVECEDIESSFKRIIEAGIRVSKIQISSAVKCDVDAECSEALLPFNDDVYLHQVKGLSSDGEILSWSDLPDFFENPADATECRVHCHVPLYFEGNDKVSSTSSLLTSSFFYCVLNAGVEHLEIETYTFNVLPEELRMRGVVGSIVDEYNWVIERIS